MGCRASAVRCLQVAPPAQPGSLGGGRLSLRVALSQPYTPSRSHRRATRAANKTEFVEELPKTTGLTQRGWEGAQRGRKVASATLLWNGSFVTTSCGNPSSVLAGRAREWTVGRKGQARRWRASPRQRAGSSQRSGGKAGDRDTLRVGGVASQSIRRFGSRAV